LLQLISIRDGALDGSVSHYLQNARRGARITAVELTEFVVRFNKKDWPPLLARRH
jgi:hypothetical protein